MKKIWQYISYLGLKNKHNDLHNRSNILTSQLNFIMLLVMLLLSLTTIVTGYLGGGPMDFGTYRLFMLIGVNIIIFFFIFKGFFLISKILLVFIPCILLLILPTVHNFVEVESFFYYPLIIIGMSLLPQIIFIPKVDRFIFWLSLFYFAILLIFSFEFLAYYSPERFVVIDIISEILFYYKLIPIIVFVFIHSALYYLRYINVNYEKELIKYNNELNNAIEELKVTQQYLIQSEKMASLGTLTYGVTHEVNNPLNYINGGLLIMLNTKKDIEKYSLDEIKERFSQAYDIIETGVEKVSYIVNSLTAFSDRGEPKLESVNIKELIERTIIFLRSDKTKNINFLRDYSYDSFIMVYQAKLLHAIYNILENAIYAVQKNAGEKIIEINTSKIEDGVNITIFNNGPRIPENILPQIFDPFFTTKDPGKGTGLGLSISYSLISEHDGLISVENVDNGVMFTIKLPLS